MVAFERRLRRVEQLSDGVSDFYDCATRSWPGIRVKKGKTEQQFDAHNCNDYPPLHN